jgi:hypothetical protein
MNGYASPLSDEVANVWLNAAMQYAETRGYTFDPACLADLSAFLNNAAARLRESREEASADSHLQDVRHLVQYMIEELDAQSPGDRELHEWTLANAKTRLCPLFPFC